MGNTPDSGDGGMKINFKVEDSKAQVNFNASSSNLQPKNTFQQGGGGQGGNYDRSGGEEAVRFVQDDVTLTFAFWRDHVASMDRSQQQVTVLCCFCLVRFFRPIRNSLSLCST